MRKIVLVVAGLMLLGACGGVQTEAESVVPDGYTLYNRTADGFTIAVPDSWVSRQFNRAALLAELDALEAAGADPEAIRLRREVIENMEVDERFALLAGHPVDDYPNIGVRTYGFGSSEEPDFLERLEADLPAMMKEKVGATLNIVERVKCGGVDCLYTRSVEMDPTGLRSCTDQYHVVGEDRYLRFTFTTADPDADEAVFESIMSTLTLEG